MSPTVQQALAAVLRRFDADLVVSTCGHASRDLQAVADRPGHFYLVGSMGMAAPVALGAALAAPGRRVLAIDGDGSVAMNLGALPMVAAHDADLLHVVLDNGVHESTGGQATVRAADLAALARAAGYRAAASVADLAGIDTIILDERPALLHVRCSPRTEPVPERIRLTPGQLVDRAREALTA